jgi:hypothetical protein
MRFLRRLVRGLMIGQHRALFTGATAVLGVAGSLLAEDARLVRNWLAVSGAALLMYGSDRASDMDRETRVLAKNSDKDLDEIRADVLDGKGARAQAVLFSAAGLCIAAWVALLVIDG